MTEKIVDWDVKNQIKQEPGGQYQHNILHFSVGSNGERSGSVVECLTRDLGAAGSSLTALCP